MNDYHNGLRIAFGFLLLFASKTQAQLRIEELQDVATMAVATKRVSHFRPWTKELNGTLSYCLGDVPYQPLTGQLAADYYPLKGMIRIELIRSNYSGGASKGELNPAFWEPGIRQAISIVCHEIQLISEWREKDDPVLLNHLREDNDRLEQIFHDRLAAYAKQNGLSIPKSVEPCTYAKVYTTAAGPTTTITVSTQPEDCVLQMMPTLAYIIAMSKGQNPVELPVVSHGKQEPLLGEFVVSMTHQKSSRKLDPTAMSIKAVGDVTFFIEGYPRVKEQSK